jgi:predicted dehydrogenase
MVKESVRWGIIGPGAISRTFASDLKEAEGASLVAVGSRSEDRAQNFAKELDIPRYYGSYEELAADNSIDAVYIGTPHAFHEENTILCLEHGKHVLCEKPLAINAAQALRMIGKAEAGGLLLMEAMWSRFLPVHVKLREILEAEAVGEPRYLTADFGFKAGFDPASRLFDPGLGGGALLDIGIYPLSLSSMVFGPAVEASGYATLGGTGVDEECSFLLRHERGQMSSGFASFRCDTYREAVIHGTEGIIRIEAPWWKSTRLIVEPLDSESSSYDLPFRGNGFIQEAEAFMDLVRNGMTDSTVMPVKESLSIMRTMDRLRERWGVIYPME